MGNAEYMGTHPIFESDFDCLTEIVMSARLIPGRLLFSGLRGTGGAARFGLTCVAGAVFLETVFTECSEDWFMNTYNAGKSFESILPEILAQQAAMASDDDEDEDEDDE